MKITSKTEDDLLLVSQADVLHIFVKQKTLRRTPVCSGSHAEFLKQSRMLNPCRAIRVLQPFLYATPFLE
jgi:hypothetical protein